MRDIDNTPTEKASGESSCSGLAAFSLGRQELSTIEGLNSSPRATESESWLPTVAFGNGDNFEEKGTGYIPEKDDDFQRGTGWNPEKDEPIENKGMGYIPENDDDPIENKGMGYIPEDDDDPIENKGMGYIPEDDDDPIENKGMGYIPEDDDDPIENKGMGWIPEKEDNFERGTGYILESDDLEERGMGYLRDAVNQVWESIAADGSILRFDALGRTLARTSLTDRGSVITEFDPETGDVSRSTETRLGQSGEHIVTLRNSAGHMVLESQITGDETESRVVTTSFGDNGKPVFLTRQSSAGNAYLVLDSNTGGIIQSGAVDRSGNWQYENAES